MATPSNEKIMHAAQQEKRSQSRQPGRESAMAQKPEAERSGYKGSGKLAGKVALITGGDSGIGRAVAIIFAKEGARVLISYLEEHADAQETKRMVEAHGQACELVAGDIRSETVCKELVAMAVSKFGRLDILVNNAAEQHEQENMTDITAEQLRSTFETNVFSFFYLTAAALPHLCAGATIINSTSVTAYKGSADKIDYAATKGAIIAFTRSLSQAVVDKGIRVNAVAPGPIWTPLIPATMSQQQIAQFGQQVPMKRAGQPAEIAPCYVFLASEDSSYMTGQVLHPNGGVIVNG